jgi:hypothetical protein
MIQRSHCRDAENTEVTQRRSGFFRGFGAFAGDRRPTSNLPVYYSGRIGLCQLKLGEGSQSAEGSERYSARLRVNSLNCLNRLILTAVPERRNPLRAVGTSIAFIRPLQYLSR